MVFPKIEMFMFPVIMEVERSSTIEKSIANNSGSAWDRPKPEKRVNITNKYKYRHHVSKTKTLGRGFCFGRSHVLPAIQGEAIGELDAWVVVVVVVLVVVVAFVSMDLKHSEFQCFFCVAVLQLPRNKKKTIVCFALPYSRSGIIFLKPPHLVVSWRCC